ncbi:MAG TPA: helix-turn-helix transcriptional regulator [Flavisolibacter sp.]|nr:helix-turn-helix transcriptional regulator [Flavisolibacter sp.]
MAKKVNRKQRKKATTGHFDYDEFFNALSDRIKDVRKEKGFTSAELFAYDIEVSRVGMSNYESGNFDDIRLRTLLKIIDGLEVTPKEFFSKILDSVNYKKTDKRK